MKRAHWRALLLAFALGVLPALVASAECRHRVVLLTLPQEADAVALEILARLRGELTAAELEVVTIPAATGVDLKTAVESAGKDLAPAAVIAMRYLPNSAPEQASAEVWISDRLSNRTVMQVARLTSLQTNPAARLAVQVAELLKARLALLWVQPQPVTSPASPPPPEPTPVVPVEPRVIIRAPEPGRFTAGAGVGVAHHFVGNVSSWVPSVQVGVEAVETSWVALAVRFHGSLTPSDTELSRDAGSARVNQAWLLAQVALRFVPRAVVQPMLSAGGGAFSAGVAGEAESPNSTSKRRTWSAASVLGLGLWIEPTPGVAWVLEGQGLAAWAKTAVRIDGERVAALGFPAALVSASVIGRY